MSRYQTAWRAVGATVAAGVFLASTLLARRGVSELEAKMFRTPNDAEDWLVPVVWAPMQAGALGAPLALGASQLAAGNPARGLRTAAGGFTAWLAAKGVKKNVRRARPAAHLEGVNLRFGSADHGLGYPSGHAAVAVIVARSLTSDRPVGWKAAGAALAGVVGLSRMYVGAHYPLDVVGGWAMGWLVMDAADVATAAVERILQDA